MTLPIYQIDAFTDTVFTGNPAAVVLLNDWLADETLQAIAGENNLSETAYLVPGDRPDRFGLRWFTPMHEVEMCGHATLASGHLVLSHLAPDLDTVIFETRQVGELTVRRDEHSYALSLPAWVPTPYDPPSGLIEALGGPQPRAVMKNRYVMVAYDHGDAVRGLRPDLRKIAELDEEVVVTAPARDGLDVVSRFFAPANGIDEDPVTGSAHAIVIPYWADQLGRDTLFACQASRRGGHLLARYDRAAGRVVLSGKCVEFLTGTIHL